MALQHWPKEGILAARLYDRDSRERHPGRRPTDRSKNSNPKKDISKQRGNNRCPPSDDRYCCLTLSPQRATRHQGTNSAARERAYRVRISSRIPIASSSLIQIPHSLFFIHPLHHHPSPVKPSSHCPRNLEHPTPSILHLRLLSFDSRSSFCLTAPPSIFRAAFPQFSLLLPKAHLPSWSTSNNHPKGVSRAQQAADCTLLIAGVPPS